MKDDYDDYDDEDRPRRRWLLPAIIAVVALGIGVLVFRAMSGDDTDSASNGLTPSDSAGPVSSETLGDGVPANSDTAGASDSTDPAVTNATADSSSGTESSAAPADPATTAPKVASSPAAPTSAPTTTAAPAPEALATYPTLPDGSPQPVLAVYDVGQVALSGFVPSQDAKDKLGVLALANARDPSNTRLLNFLEIDPTVPIDIGVRVVELTSARFPDGSADILGPHGLELARIATVMKILPKITALVIGHSDQRGDDEANFKLSSERAAAVVTYLVGAGVQASRLSSRAVGETDLLTLNSDATALQLNRRTEFILYGLLLPD